MDLTKLHTAPEKRNLTGYTITPFFTDLSTTRTCGPASLVLIPAYQFIIKYFFPNGEHSDLACGNGDSLYDLAVKFSDVLKMIH